MFEYKVVPILMAVYSTSLPFVISGTIDELGKEGWELVTIIEIGNKEHVAYFKRKLDA